MKNNKVSQASTKVTNSGEITLRTRKSQIYAHIEEVAVIAKTPRSLINFGVSSTANIDTPLMTSKLNAAEPTIVAGPRTGGTASISYKV